MENVPDVIGVKNIEHFRAWRDKLEDIGYKNYYQILNAKDFGIPQNRERCFMISILGDYFYEFPEPIKLEKRLKDLLEEEVDEKYYLSETAILGSLNTNFKSSQLKNKVPKNGIVPTICARDYKDPKIVQLEVGGGVESTTPKIIRYGKVYEIVKNSENFIQWYQEGRLDMETRAWKVEKIAPTLTTGCEKILIIETRSENGNKNKVKDKK